MLVKVKDGLMKASRYVIVSKAAIQLQYIVVSRRCRSERRVDYFEQDLCESIFQRIEASTRVIVDLRIWCLSTVNEVHLSTGLMFYNKGKWE